MVPAFAGRPAERSCEARLYQRTAEVLICDSPALQGRVSIARDPHITAASCSAPRPRPGFPARRDWLLVDHWLMLGMTARSTRVSGDHSFERISALPQWK